MQTIELVYSESCRQLGAALRKNFAVDRNGQMPDADLAEKLIGNMYKPTRIELMSRFVNHLDSLTGLEVAMKYLRENVGDEFPSLIEEHPHSIAPIEHSGLNRATQEVREKAPNTINLSVSDKLL